MGTMAHGQDSRVCNSRLLETTQVVISRNQLNVLCSIYTLENSKAIKKIGKHSTDVTVSMTLLNEEKLAQRM